MQGQFISGFEVVIAFHSISHYWVNPQSCTSKYMEWFSASKPKPPTALLASHGHTQQSVHVLAKWP